MQNIENNRNIFFNFRISEENSKWQKSIERKEKKDKNLRSEFEIDYNRILYSTAFRRLKHKTQVFFAPENDHICTRIEHVNLVASLSYTLSNFLGLNTELATASAIGHDVGHSPFGHAGEKILDEISWRYLKCNFFHEKNSLKFIDKIETLESKVGKIQNLNLTYAVRDSIICHCGEVNVDGLFPRDEELDLWDFEKSNQYAPFTWEGCIVKIADKIAYLGRDIEDAKTLDLLKITQLKELSKLSKIPLKEINNSTLLHEIISDLCLNSNIKKGLKFSKRIFELINTTYQFNYYFIYEHDRLGSYKQFIRLIIYSIFNTLVELYDGFKTIDSIKKIISKKQPFPFLINAFYEWLIKYSINNKVTHRPNYYNNEIIYNLDNKNNFIQAIIDFISGMTDNFALKIFKELTSFN